MRYLIVKEHCPLWVGIQWTYVFCSSLYIAVFIQPTTWAFYTASVLIGIAAAGKHCSYSADYFYEIWIYLWNIFISWAINSVCFSPLDSPGKLLDWKFWWKHHWKEQWNILGTSTVQVSFNFKLNNSICWLIFNYFDFWEDFLVVYTFCFLHLYTSGRLHWKILFWGLAVSWKKGWKQPFYWCCALQNRE